MNRVEWRSTGSAWLSIAKAFHLFNTRLNLKLVYQINAPTLQDSLKKKKNLQQLADKHLIVLAKLYNWPLPGKWFPT